MRNRVLSACMSLLLLAALLPAGGAVTALAAGRLPFPDVKESDWFYAPLCDLYAGGVINGMPDGRYAPDGTVSWGEALKLLLRAAGYPEKPTLGGHWADGYQEFALAIGFLDKKQSLSQSIPRRELGVLMGRVLRLTPTDGASPFADVSDPRLTVLYQENLMEGELVGGQRRFQPERSLTRSEAAAVVWRMMTYCEEKHLEPLKTIPFQKKEIPILESVPKNTYDPSLFVRDERGYMIYQSEQYQSKIGIDVSSYQKDIDWQAVKDAGIEFAIIRVGGRGYGKKGNLYADNCFEKNMAGAQAVGLEIGVYFFSQAITPEEAREEALYTLERIKPYQLTYPVVFDWEYFTNENARTDGLDADTLGKCAQAFCETVKEHGYSTMVYFNLAAAYLFYDLTDIVAYPFWFAQYYKVPQLYYHFDMWQYSSKGTVPGITGGVDMNLQLIPRG